MPLKYLLLMIFLIGCSSIKDTRNSDGKIYSEITCGHMNECFQQAVDHCGDFEVADSAMDENEFILVVECKRKS